MARDRKRSKQRQQRRAQTRRNDGRVAAERAFGRSADDDAAALNGAEQEAAESPPESGGEEVFEVHHHDEPHGAEHEVDLAAADPELLSADPEIIDDPTADARFGTGAEPDFDAPVRPPLQRSDYDEGEEESPGGGAVTGVRARPAPGRPAKGNRVIGFLRASWAELQRVQWPNRQQVFQATAVVLGFVAVAGAFLALADFVAGKVVDAIL